MTLRELARTLREAAGVANKKDVQIAADALPWAVAGPWGSETVRLGDDCAAIPDGDGYLLFAAEGMLPEFVENEPKAAGYCSVLVNASDVYSMGGRPLAVVDALFGDDSSAAARVLEGMKAAARDLGIAIVGGHTNLKSPYAALMVAIVGRARALLTSFDARAGDELIAVFDLRGRMAAERPFFDATRGAPALRMRADYELLPGFAEGGLCRAAKDISMGGLFGSLLMLLESSGVGARLDLDAVPRPPGVDSTRWLLTFPSYGFLLAVPPERCAPVLASFAARELSAAVVGSFDGSGTLSLCSGTQREVAWDLSDDGLTRRARTEPDDV
jgi:AIR synthase-related protein